MIRRQKTTHGFKQYYKPEDSVLWARMDDRYHTLHGAVIKKLCERMYTTYPYQKLSTRYEKFKSLDNSRHYLKEGVSFEQLDSIATAVTDNQAMDQLKQQRRKLFQTIIEQNQLCA